MPDTIGNISVPEPYDSDACPFSTTGAPDLVHFSTADATKCDKGPALRALQVQPTEALRSE